MKRPSILPLPPQSELLKRFRYDEETGQLFYVLKSGGLKKKGWLGEDGYIRIAFDYKIWLAHRIIWKMKTGSDPVGYIDHIDGTKENRWRNLRDVTHNQNMWNSKPFRNNTSGFRGVHFAKYNGLWRSEICVGHKNKHLGYFKTREQAHAAFVAATKTYRDEHARV